MDSRGLKLGFKEVGLLGLGVFFLLLSLQLHLLLALPPTDLNQEKQIGREHKIKVVTRHISGAVGSHGGGGYGNAGNAATDNGGGVIPVYAAGSNKHNRYHRHRGSNSGTINCVSFSCFVLILFVSFLFLFSISM
ncbi:hypothetical protein DITRI_Ditri05aG0058100 [Diplodiscus trichospermus]